MELKDYLPLGSAIVAVAALGFAIFSWRRNQRGLLKVDARFIEAFVIGGASKHLGKKIKVEITNAGVDARLVQLVGLRVDPKTGLSRFLQIHLIEELKDLPAKLGRGEQLSFSIDHEVLAGNPIATGLTPGDSFRVMVQDTLGKQYLANPLTYSY